MTDPYEPPRPGKLESWHAKEDKLRWKIVRLDTAEDVPGDILTADELTGECNMSVDGEIKTLSLGERGLRIVRR
jgi:hypothetical protein